MNLTDLVPTLVDPEAGLQLRALRQEDLPAVVEQCRDPEMIGYTPVPVPYGTEQAREFLAAVTGGWRFGDSRSWVIEAERDGRDQFCGSISLRLEGETGEVGFGLHPGARGRGLSVAALRLVSAYGFDVAGLTTLRWRARVGNWASRRVAATAGFRFDGTVRRLLEHRGTLVDGWVATLLADDPRRDRRWRRQPELSGAGVVLRPFRESDAARVAEACGDRRSEFWLASLPDPYGLDDATDYIAATHEDEAAEVAWSWCVADAEDDRCLGAISLDGFGGYHRRSEIGYWAHPQARGRGVMSEAARVLTHYAETELARDCLIIRCAAGNTASRHVAEAAGYREVGVLIDAEPLGDGTRTDLVVYARP